MVSHTVEVDVAKEKWQEYCQHLRDNKHDPDPTIEQLKDIYYQLSKGRQVIDVWESMKLGGKNEFDQPILAIARAHRKEVIFQKREGGAGAFWSDEGWRWGASQYPMVAVPENTFNPWRVDNVEMTRFNGTKYFQKKIIETSMVAPVPIIPAEYRPEAKLERYFILWEVEKWEKEPPRDPFLLRRLSSNLFVVLAAWDLTELERAVMRGAILE